MTALLHSVTMREERIGGIPAIHAAPAQGFDRPLPTVFFHHGFTSSKELSAFFGYLLAQAGMRVVLPEADGHGERFDGDEQARLGRFWHILRRSLDELPALQAHCVSQGWTTPDCMAVAGSSMGGFAALGCLARDSRLRAAACFMGSAYFEALSATLYPPAQPLRLDDVDPSQHLDRLVDRPLFLWHGDCDPIVPVSHAQQLHDALRARCTARQPVLMRDAQAEHKIPMGAAVAGVRFLRDALR